MSNEANESLDPILELYRQVVARSGGWPNHLLEKSSLYQRLKEGKAPLILPPPLKHSYPWYDVVEADAAIEIVEEPYQWESEEPGRREVLIGQSIWTVLSGWGTHDLTVTYPGWQELGFTWKVWRTTVTAEESSVSLVCWHRVDVPRLTTPELVQAECEYYADKEIRWLQLAAQHSEAELVELYLEDRAGKHPGRERFELAAAKFEVSRFVRQLQARRESGLPDIPSAPERASKIEKRRESLLGGGWSVVDGRLMRDTWMMQRVSPTTIGPDHYMKDI